MNLILNNNSPLGPVWRQAALRMMETGVGHKFDRLWLGELKSSTSIEDTLMVLKPTQLVLVFFVVAFSLIGCLIILVIEKLYFRIRDFDSWENNTTEWMRHERNDNRPRIARLMEY